MTRQRKQVRISEIIIPKYLPIFNNRSYKHIILTSGRAGTKSSYAAIRAVYQIVSDPYGSAVVLRKHHNKLRKTVYKEMLRGIGRLQIPKSRFTITKSPMEITYRANGSTIYFSGSDGIDDTKGIIDEDKPIKLVILDELTEFFDDGEGEDELQNIEATFIRGNSSGFQMIYLYNPPKNPNAPIVQWCQKMEQRPDCVHIHTDYRDVPIKWLGKDLIESAEMMRELDEKQYRWVWGGESIGIDDLIIYMSRTQIGYALQYKQPQHAILMVHQRHKERLDKFSVEVRGSQFVTPYFNKDKKASVYMYVDWVTDEVLPTLHKTGSYEMPKKDTDKREKLPSVNQMVKNIKGAFPL